MKKENSFHGDPDPRVAEALAAHFGGPDSGGFVARLGTTLRGLPARDSEWDVLATWARPRVVAAAMAAGFLLGMMMWQRWQRPVEDSVSPVSVAVFDTPQPPELNPVINVVLEDR